jgi:cytochrome c5
MIRAFSSTMRVAERILCAALMLLSLRRPAHAETLTGAEVYTDACATCHGKDGRGAPQGSAIVVPLPDFTDCITATSEPTANWEGLIRYGSAFLGLSNQMPAFGEALSDEEIVAVIHYVRRFCDDPRYPLGDLNYPRPLFIEKAYPEDEAVLSFDYESATSQRVAGWEAAIEKRLGARGQVEVALPAALVDPDGGGSSGGVGDLGISYKYALLADEAWHSIVTARLALALPTGKTSDGIGSGTTVVSPQLLAAHSLGPLVVQAEIVAELPRRPARRSADGLRGGAPVSLRSLQEEPRRRPRDRADAGARQWRARLHRARTDALRATQPARSRRPRRRRPTAGGGHAALRLAARLVHSLGLRRRPAVGLVSAARRTAMPRVADGFQRAALPCAAHARVRG